MRSAVTLLLINQRRAAVRSAVVGGRERGSRLRETQQPLTRCGDSRLYDADAGNGLDETDLYWGRMTIQDWQ